MDTINQRGYLRSAFDATTGFSERNLAQAELTQAQERFSQAKKEADIYGRVGTYATLNPEQALSIGKAESETGYEASKNSHAHITELAQTLDRRAGMGVQAVKTVQDINAGIAYT